MLACLMAVFSINDILLASDGLASNNTAPVPCIKPKVSESISSSVLYLPIADALVKAIPIRECQEKVIDLLEVKEPRLKPRSAVDTSYCPAYEGYSRVRLGVYRRLVSMLRYLPKDIGIAYSEGFRPFSKQKEYFDAIFKDFLHKTKDGKEAYGEAAKLVSPFIDNKPTHCTGAAIDMALFRIKDDSNLEVLDMGLYDSSKDNDNETFTTSITEIQKENRLLLLKSATKAGLVNYGYEWWHYSYGDRAWAYAKGEKYAIYDLVVDKSDPILMITKESYLAEASLHTDTK